MPKLKERPEVKQDRMFAALLAKNMELCMVESQKELAQMLGINKTTMTYKLKDPDKFTRRELRKIFKVLKYSEDEKAQVM